MERLSVQGTVEKWAMSEIHGYSLVYPLRRVMTAVRMSPPTLRRTLAAK